MATTTDGKYRPFGGQLRKTDFLRDVNSIRNITPNRFHEQGGYLTDNESLNIDKWDEIHDMDNNEPNDIIYFIGEAPNEITWKNNNKDNEYNINGGVWMTLDDLDRVANQKPTKLLYKKNSIMKFARAYLRLNTLAPQKVYLSKEFETDYNNTYIEAGNILDNRKLSSLDLNQANILAKIFIDHAKYRLNLLREKLSKNPDVEIVVAGNSTTNEHYLSKGLAVDQWKTNKYGDYSKEINIVAWKLFIDYLTEELNKLKTFFSNRVIFDTFDRTKASDLHIIVWGANLKNWNDVGLNNVVIPDGGQAAAASPYGPGVFGIITTPVKGLPPPVPQKPVNNKYLTYKNNFNQSKYYEKYLKYKLKYNQLKEKFN
jgi:hypothetical protein